MHQRVVKVTATPVAGGLQVTLPTSKGVVPPGHYMLFVLDSQGIPSTAKFIKVN